MTGYLNDQTRVFNFEVPGSNYIRLKAGDRKALKHLIKAAQALDEVFLKQDHPENIPVKAFLQKAAAGGNTQAQKTLRLFESFYGIQGFNKLTNEPVNLV